MIRRCIAGSWRLDPAGVGAGLVQAAAWADRMFPENRHDFGPVPRGAKVKHDFVLINRLAEPVTILNLRPSCGCTSGKASASMVEPGRDGRDRGPDGHAEFPRPQVDDPVRHAGDRQRPRGRGPAGRQRRRSSATSC